MKYKHIPVMLAEILEHLNPRSGGNYIDCTLGGAGYTVALAESVGPKGKIVGIDLDELAIKNAEHRIAEKKLKNIILINDNFKNLTSIAADNFGEKTGLDGVVFDLGLSSAQLDDETRGFSFKGDRPLNMAFGPQNSRLTADIVNDYSLLELTDIFRAYGEERRAYYIAKAIVSARRLKRIETTTDLLTVIESAVPFRHYSKINPATKIFQALRMETNDELNVLKNVLPEAISILKPGGRLVIVSFHSGEDRIVKRFLKENKEVKILTKRPLVAAESEIVDNPRARSAKLRVAEKI
jgi:16S rRNA (cytosine1402-N4)-methyltransferase